MSRCSPAAVPPRSVAMLVAATLVGVASVAAKPASLLAQARPDTTVRVVWGGYVDTYYAWDVGEPESLDRAFRSGNLFMTQPARHNEFNVNLAFVEARLEHPSLRGRFALQAGTAVLSNYAGEPTRGAISGPGIAQLIQEAVVGAKVADDVWIDGGVFFSHMGMESWISRDNPTYTRSLVAEYSPYYQSGVKLTWTPAATLSARLDVVNGWQNISESNTGKGAGARLDYAPVPAATLSYYNFFSNEAGNLLRSFHGVGAKYVRGDLTLLGQADAGRQDGAAGAANSSWYGLVAIARQQLTRAVSVAGRLERFDDADGVVVVTGVAGAPFAASGASVGVDVALQSRALWRSEVRGWRNDTAAFRDDTGAATRTSLVFVTSLALSF